MTENKLSPLNFIPKSLLCFPRIRLLESRPDNDVDNRSTSTSTPQPIQPPSTEPTATPQQGTSPAPKKGSEDEEEEEEAAPSQDMDVVSFPIDLRYFFALILLYKIELHIRLCICVYKCMSA